MIWYPSESSTRERNPVKRLLLLIAVVLIASACVVAADVSVLRERRQKTARAFPDGVLLVHAFARVDFTADGYRQDPYFYYLTGLDNSIGAILAIEGKSGESWLFLPSEPPLLKRGLKPPVVPGPDAGRQFGIEHVVDWSELDAFLAARAASTPRLYFVKDLNTVEEMPANLVSPKTPHAPLWFQLILKKWPAFEAKDATDTLDALMAVQSAEEVAALRSAAKATIAAITAGMRAVHPGVWQRVVESAVESACWNAGAHGTSFWPWAMAGENAVFPKPFTSMGVYDHHNREMRAGELVRLDVGCEWEHYSGDLGRTVPVSGRYNDDQRETWNIFVAAYRVAAAAIREGVKVDDVYDAWRAELLRHRASAKSPLAQHAIDSWTKRDNVPYWQIHTMNLVAALPPEPLTAGMTINFEPIASIDGQGFFLEDMYLITKTGAEILTPGVPYTAEEIEAAMR
jgi:Xaa-Pro aminopeptidase